MFSEKDVVEECEVCVVAYRKRTHSKMILHQLMTQ